MAEFDEAFYINNNSYISINEYDDVLHYKNIVCPECRTAKIHFVNKQKTKYFASNRKKEHSEDCQHYEEHIPNRNLLKLVNSKDIKDKERLMFLIKNNLKSAIQLLLNKDSKSITFFNDNILESLEEKLKSRNPNLHKKESISRVHIKNLSKKKENYINKYILIYGISSIEKRDAKYGKQMMFKFNDKNVFSIFISEKQLLHIPKMKNENLNIGFAVFGKLTQNGIYLNIKIILGQHLTII